jgi:nitrile hydratase accessory protein
MRELEQKYIGELDGVASAPKRCDRLTFDEPWQSRAFGMVLALSEGKTIVFEDFRQSLIATIGQWEKGHDLHDETWEYYEQWLAAFEALAVTRGLITKTELDARTVEFENRTRTELI